MIVEATEQHPPPNLPPSQKRAMGGGIEEPVGDYREVRRRVFELASTMKEYARALRKNMTDAENRVWYFLRGKRLNGYRFIREHPIGPYIADFVCRQQKVIVELDGGQHADAAEYDEKRTEFLKEKGYKVLRFWNNDVFSNIEGVLEAVLAVLEGSEFYSESQLEVPVSSSKPIQRPPS